MKYLKIILTVIAIDLTLIVLQNVNLIPVAMAGNKSGTIDVNIQSINNRQIYGDEVPVIIKSK